MLLPAPMIFSTLRTALLASLLCAAGPSPAQTPPPPARKPLVLAPTVEGLLLCEIAPGADLRRDILEKMEFTPLIAPDLREMDAALFAE